MASNSNPQKTTRGYAIDSNSKGNTSTSFRDEIGALSSMIQRGTTTETFNQRGDLLRDHGQPRGVSVLPSFQQQHQSRWGKYSETSPGTSTNENMQSCLPLPSRDPNNAPVHQDPHTFTHFCSICNVSCNHETAYIQHLNGKKHQKKSAQLTADSGNVNTLVSSLNVLKGQKNGMDPLVFPPPTLSLACTPAPSMPSSLQSNQKSKSRDGTAESLIIAGENNSASKGHKEYFCSICNVTCNHYLAYRQHIEGKRHQKQMSHLSSGIAVGDPRNNTIRYMHGPVVPQEAGATIPRTSDSTVSAISDPRLEENSFAMDSSTNTVPLAPGNEEDSEEEGEVDEAKEDIEHLYNDFDEPHSASGVDSEGALNNKQRVQAEADSDIDEMFGEDDDKHVRGDDGMSDQDISDMFGDVDSDADVKQSPDENKDSFALSSEISPLQNDDDVDDMFGESSDEEDKYKNKKNDQALILPKYAPETATIEMSHNSTSQKPLRGLSRSKSNENDSVGIAPNHNDRIDSKPKRVTFSVKPLLDSKCESSNIPLTASGALAAARLRASISKVKIPVATASSSPRSLLKKRKTSISSSAITGQQRTANISKRSYYQQVHPDKFWSLLRSWDFIGELNIATRKGRKPLKKSDQTNTGKKRSFDDANSDKNSSNILPDSFDSIAHYQALWAPLLVEEAKAQLLSEVLSAQSSTSTSWMKRGKLVMGAVVKVELSRSARDLPGDSKGGSNTTPLEPTVTLHLRSMTRGASIGSPVGPNDLLILVREASIVEMALRGNALNNSDGIAANKSVMQDLTKGRLGFVVHALNRRSRSIDGLLVRASQSGWDQFSTLEEMYVIRIGSNVTALREFNALVRLDEVPLSKYLLNGKKCSAEETLSHSVDNIANEAKVDPLSQSGLPVGFRIYVKSKMNASQLQAITASATEYGSGGFTLIKGPPGTGKSTTLVSILNALHLRQYQAYYEGIERIITGSDTSTYYEELAMLNKANEIKPRILVCAPSNAAIDNVVTKIINDRFVDGNGSHYSPNILRVGAGKITEAANKVSLQRNVDSIIEQGADALNLESLVENGRKQLKHLQKEIHKLKVRIQALIDACPYQICDDWEVRIMEENETFRILFVNHKASCDKLRFDKFPPLLYFPHQDFSSNQTKSTTFDIPPKVRPTEKACRIKQLPHYIALLKNLTKYVERHSSESSTLEKHIILQNHLNTIRSSKRSDEQSSSLCQELETHLLNSTHIVLTTLGSAGSQAVKSANKFEVIVIDEAAQSSEMSTLLALQLGSSHAILVGDPQQLPATVFSLSGRSNKYDRSLFQRLEQCHHPVVMLNIQYRMNPMISEFPRHIFYKGMLIDGPNTQLQDFGGVLKHRIMKAFPNFKPFQILDLDSREEREGTGLSNMHEAQLVLHLYHSLDRASDGVLAKSRIAVITPYAQQTILLHRLFEDALGGAYSTMVEISTVDAYQGRESGVVIYSCVRAGGKGSGIGFLSDVQRMNVALTRAKYFLFVIARRRSIMVNHYWRKLVSFAREKKSLIQVPTDHRGGKGKTPIFPVLAELAPVLKSSDEYPSDSDYSA